MSNNKDIEVAVQRLAGTYLKDILQIFTCTVNSVSLASRTCDCTPIGSDSSTDLPGVLLMAEADNGMLIVPKIRSTVVVALSARNLAFVIMYSTVQSVQYGDGTFGGMVKLVDASDVNAGLLARINKIETLLSDLIVKYNVHTHASSGAPPVPLETGTVTITTRAELENINITQGL